MLPFNNDSCFECYVEKLACIRTIYKCRKHPHRQPLTKLCPQSVKHILMANIKDCNYKEKDTDTDKNESKPGWITFLTGNTVHCSSLCMLGSIQVWIKILMHLPSFTDCIEPDISTHQEKILMVKILIFFCFWYILIHS